MWERLRLWSQQWQRPVLRTLLPASCALCGGAADGAVCAPCQADYVRLDIPRCPCCANPLAGAPPERPCLCGSCLAHLPPFDATVAAVDYASPLDQLVLQLKFGARLALAPWCARMLVDAVLARPDMLLPELLLPVPLGRQRLAERGFNQALEIAKPLARALGVPLQARLAVRAHDTLAQSSLAPGARQANVRHAFVLAPQMAPLVRGRHVGLVDDVMSSGHTLGELAALLKRFGATRVSNLVFARTPPH